MIYEFSIFLVASFIRHGYVELDNCTLHAISEFPDWFTARPPRYDFVCLCTLITAYSFLAIAIVCDDYCVPSVERICYSQYLRLAGGVSCISKIFFRICFRIWHEL